MKKRNRLLSMTLLAAALSVGGCGMLDVTNPGPTPDEKLNEPGSAAGLVNGMSYAMSNSLNYLVEMVGVVSGELSFSGSLGNFGGTNGVVQPSDLNSTWSRIQRARWVAEDGIRRMQTTLGDGYTSNGYAARANLLAGISNRFLGENFCDAVIDGGPRQDRSVYFQRADSQFTAAIAIGQAAGINAYVTAAYGGRAEVRAALGRWDEAIADAAKVPTAFRYDALFSDKSSDQWNAVYNETHTKTNIQFTVYDSRWATRHGDPRVPWDTLFASDGSVAKAANGKTPVFQQKKYVALGSSIPLVKGTALRTLEAEAALRKNDVPGAVAKLNDERATYSLPAISTTITADSAWKLLRYERSAVTWLEGRQLWDASRWFAATGAAHDDFMKNRSLCLPVSEAEAESNPNLK